MKYDKLGIDLTKKYGYGFDDYSTDRLPRLSAEDEEKWYSKFYYAGRAKLTEAQEKIFAKGNTMDPKNALLPGDVDKLTKPGEIEGDLGYCLLPNGVGYGSTHTMMHGITLEMYDWYKKLRMVDRLSYQIWYPGSHASELGGVTVEDVGFGNSTFEFISPNDPENLGFTDAPSKMDPDFCCIIGSNCFIKNLEHKEIHSYASSLFHYVRNTPIGLDFRTHFYIGAHCLDGKLVRIQKIDPDVCLELTRQMASHCMHERGHVENILPELYEKMKDYDLSAVADLAGDMAIQR